MNDRIRIDLSAAEPGATRETLKATEIIVEMLNGFPTYLALSALTNASAMVLCHVAKTETDAVEESKNVRKEIERCIRKNYHLFSRKTS